MRVLPIMAGAGLLIFGVLWMKKSKADTGLPLAPPADTLRALFRKWASIYSVDPLLIEAHAMVESSLNPLAVNKSDPSYGLMQVLCSGSSDVCTNKFNVDGWAGMTRQRLLDPDVNIKIATQIIAYNLRTWGYPRGIAVYNSWESRRSHVNGPFPNQRYVDNVLAKLRQLGGA